MKQIRIEIIYPLQDIYDKTDAYEKYLEVDSKLQEHIKSLFPEIIFDTFYVEDVSED